ncbi:hypothetical protein [Kitasatospora viridis]|uniref:Uncharacterized protein n=1 Tax=Kitasatospora viridis TaxID=281105 RepID=A0A561UM94_9ACTN|nr:hypothetical protein [Kitasatospora viridis]TWG00496.1 hypothetical protein FHX73_114375 [Kitasatospora viridis]
MDEEWPEQEYLSCLNGERQCYAWVMRHYGGRTGADAEAAALACYPYEPPGTPYRGLVFHDEAWHWAMLRIHGGDYAREHPELVIPPDEYLALD